MPRRVKGPDGVMHAFPDDATDDEVRAALGGETTAPAKPQIAPGSTFGEKIGNAARMLGNVAVGAVKGAAHTVLDLGELAGHIPNLTNPLAPNLRESVDELYGKPGLSAAAMPAAREATAYQNTPERIGGALETAAEMAIPVAKGATAAKAAIPSTARAGEAFKSVMGAARNIPVDISSPGNVALRIQELADRGGGAMPRPITQFLRRVTDPDKIPLAYEEARDFASGISRLSRDEFNRLSPVIQREVGNLRVTLNRAVADAAGKAGKGIEHAQAMKEFAQAKKIQGAINGFYEGIQKKAVPYAVGGAAAGAAAGSWIGKHISSLWGGE